MPAVTVLVPTHDHGPLILRAVATAFRQTVQEIEILIVGDGVTPETREAVRELERDERVRYFDHPKGPRRGEAYRHAVLRDHARGEIVCYLADDDLWLPGHVELMRAALAEADFAHAPPIMVYPDGRIRAWPVDLTLPDHRRRVLTTRGFFPLSSQAHTMEMYRRLPYGWRTTPEGIGTDTYMAQQFLAERGCRAVSSVRPTFVAFPHGYRKSWTLEQRLAELDEWSAKLAMPEGRESFLVEVLRDTRARYLSLENSRTWRLRNRLRRAPLMTR